jgi:hypothetical protein
MELVGFVNGLSRVSGIRKWRMANAASATAAKKKKADG